MLSPSMKLSPNALNNLYNTEGIPHSTDVISLLMLSSTVLNNLHSTEAILPLYWATSTVLKLSPHSTDVISPMYWTTSNVLNDLHSTEPTLYYMGC